MLTNTHDVHLVVTESIRAGLVSFSFSFGWTINELKVYLFFISSISYMTSYCTDMATFEETSFPFHIKQASFDLYASKQKKNHHPCFFNSITLLTAALNPVLNLALHR